MSERRCPNCGALVGADVEWCGQCLQRLGPPKGEVPAEAAVPGTGPSGNGGPPDGDEPEPATATAVPRGVTGVAPPPGSEAAAVAGGVHAGERGIVWDCPTCGTENPMESAICSVCGTTFASLVQPKESTPSVDPGRAAMFSLFFPGLGHYLAGRTADGVARAVVFLFALATGMVILIGGLRNGFGPLLPLMVICLACAASLYVVSTVDAGRIAHGERQVLTPRMLLYGATGLILVTLGFFIVAATAAAPRG